MAIGNFNLAETRVAIKQSRWVGVQTQSRIKPKRITEVLCLILLVSLWFYLFVLLDLHSFVIDGQSSIHCKAEKFMCIIHVINEKTSFRTGQLYIAELYQD